MRTRTILVAAALALTAAPAVGQQRGPARPAPKAEQPPPPPPIFPCRTAAEVCFLGVVIGSQVSVIFTNDPSAQAIDPRPIDAAGPDGAKLDLARNDGRVVMLTGGYDAKAGITKAELVEVASPLASLAIKAQSAGGGEEPPPPKGAPPRRR